MTRKSVTHGTPAQLEAALENKISELTDASSSTISVDDLENVTASVDWDHYDQYEPFMDQYLPAQGQGETRATQLVTALTKLIYKWYNDGDVYDNNYGMDGWCNDLSSYANWIYNTYPKTQRILNKIKDAFTDSDYENILMELAAVCFDNDFLAKENEKLADGSVYTESGPFSFSEYTDDEEDDDYQDDDDEYDDIYNSTDVASTSEWEMLQTKSVEDSDGFMTDYTLYKHSTEDKYICMFGDSELYEPDEAYADWEGETEAEALEWFNNYNGFADDESIYANAEFASSSISDGWWNKYFNVVDKSTAANASGCSVADIDECDSVFIDNDYTVVGYLVAKEAYSALLEEFEGSTLISDGEETFPAMLSHDRIYDISEEIKDCVDQDDEADLYACDNITSSNDGLPYLDIDEDKLDEARQNLYNKLDELEESFPEIGWDIVESPEDIDIAMILYVNYGLQDGEDYQIGNGETDIIIDNKNDGRWHQVATDLNYSEGDYLDSLGLEVVGLLEAQGYEAYSSVEDDNLEIEIVDEDGVQHWYLQPLDEIEPNWDDINTDASTIADAAIEEIFG